MKIIWRLENVRHFTILEHRGLEKLSYSIWRKGELSKELIDKHNELKQELAKVEEEITEYLSNPPGV